MERAIPAVAIAVLAACGAPFTPAETCTASGITIQVQGQWQTGRALAGCGYFESAVTAALALDSSFVPPAQLAEIADGLTVWVHSDNTSIICSGEAGGAGCDIGVHDIETTSNMGPLAHELLHSYDRLDGAYQGDNALAQHRDWNTRGAAPGASTYVDSTTPFGELPISVGSWWDSAEQLFRAQRSAFVETYCPTGGTC